MDFEQKFREQNKLQKEKKRSSLESVVKQPQEKKETTNNPIGMLESMRKEYETKKEKTPSNFEKILGRNKILSFVAGSLLLANVSAVEANDNEVKKEYMRSQPDSIESIVSGENFSQEEEQRKLTNFPRYVTAFLGKVFAQKVIPTDIGIVEIGDKKVKEIVDDIYFREQFKKDAENLEYNKYLKKGGHTNLSPEIRLFSKDSHGKVGLGFQINVPYGVDGLADSMRNLGGAIKEKGKIFDGTYRVGHSTKLILQDLALAFGDSVLSKQKAKDMAESGNDPLERR